MAEQKKTTRRTATKKEAPAQTKSEVAKEPELSRDGRRRYRVLTAQRNRIDARIKQALKLRADLDAIDKEIAELK